MQEAEQRIIRCQGDWSHSPCPLRTSGTKATLWSATGCDIYSHFHRLWVTSHPNATWEFLGVISSSLWRHMATYIWVNIFAWRYQAFPRSNVESSSVRSSGNHPRANSTYRSHQSLKFHCKFAYLKFDLSNSFHEVISSEFPVKMVRGEHYNDVTMDTMASQITSLTIVYSTVYSDADQRKYQSSASLAFVRGIHRRPVNSPHKWPVTRKMFPFDDVIMMSLDPIDDTSTHWGWVTHICVSKLTITDSDNGLSPSRRQAIIWTSAGILSIGPLGTNISEILIEIITFSFKEMRLKVSSAKWRPYCLGRNLLALFRIMAWDDQTIVTSYGDTQLGQHCFG